MVLFFVGNVLVPGKPAEAGWNAREIARFHQLKLVANTESGEAD
jgi:hypothetical protein